MGFAKKCWRFISAKGVNFSVVAFIYMKNRAPPATLVET